MTTLIIIFIRDFPSLQIHFLLVLSLLFQSLTFILAPFGDLLTLNSLMCQTNEFLTSSYLFLMLTLTDYHNYPEIKETSGWALTLLTAFAVVLNALKTTVVYVKSLIKKRQSGNKETGGGISENKPDGKDKNKYQIQSKE